MKPTTARPPDTRNTNNFRLGGEVRIQRLGFGAMRLPRSDWNGPARDPAIGRAVLRRAVELGVNHLDTADFYRSSDGSVRANTLIRQALYPYPSGLVIASKVGPTFGPSGPGQAAAADLRALVEANLESLGLDRLELVYLRVGRMTPPHGESIAERFEVLAALREEGLIGHLGLSNVDADHLAEARGIAPVAAVQNQFHIANRNDMAVFDTCTEGNIAFVPFGPIGGGHADLNSEPLAQVAARHGASITQIALAWLLRIAPVTLAIPGTGSMAHLEENMAASSIELSEEDVTALGGSGHIS